MILVDEGWSSTLHLARALVTAGAHVEVVTANGKSHPAFERRGVIWRSGPRLGDPRLVALLHELRGTAVIPMTEAALLADLPNAFPVVAPWQRALIADKHAMVAHAGVPYPATLPIDHSFDVDTVIARLGLPLVIRGASGNCGSHTHICETRARAAELVAMLRGTWVAQRFIASPTFLVGGVFDRGRPIRIYAGEKLEQWPRRVGPAVRMRARRDADLIAAGVRAFERLAWTGFASADFVRDATGYQLLEINPRLWGSIAAAMIAGVDMFVPFFELVTGGSPAPDLEFADGVECRIFPRNLAAHPARGLRELLGKQGRGWRSPRFLVYLLDRQPV
jgi:hypothetical protein